MPQREGADTATVCAWVVILLFVVMFWTGVAYGIERGVHAIWADPACSYNGVEMHASYGISSARCDS